MMLAEAVELRAAVVPLNPQNEAEAAPVMQRNSDPFARVDASVLARANLTDKQLTAADAQENSLRAILGASLSDLGHFGGDAWRVYLTPSSTIRRRSSGILPCRASPRIWASAPFTPGIIRKQSGDFRRHSQQNPDSAPLRGMLGMSYFAIDKYADAVKTFSPLGTPRHAGLRRRLRMGRFSGSNRRVEASIRGSVAVRKRQSASDTLLLVGQLWIEIGDYDRAVATLHRALQSNPSSQSSLLRRPG